MDFKGCHFPKDVILQGIRWYTAYPLSYRHVEELMEERGVALDQVLSQIFKKSKRELLFGHNYAARA